MPADSPHFVHAAASSAAQAPLWLRQLAGASGQAVLVGLPAALAVQGLPWPIGPAVQGPAVPLPSSVAAATVVAWRPDPDAVLPPGVTVQLVATADEVAGAVAQLLAAQPVPALAVAVTAAGAVSAAEGWANGADWSQQRLRCQGDPRKLWRPDFGGVFAIAALAAWTGLRPDRDIVRTLQRDATTVLQLDRQVWCDGLAAVLVAPRAAVGLRFLQEAMVLQLMVPEATAMVDFHVSCPVHHKDIWDHTLQVIEKCPPNVVVRWSALMHDTGKVQTRTLSKGKVHFFGHEALGASLMEGVAGRLHMDSAIRDRVVYVIGHHARANAYLANWTDSAVRRLVRDMGEHLDDVLAFSRSDYTTKRSGRIAEVQGLTAQLAVRIPELVAEASKQPPLPKGLGTHILAQTGLQAGPWLGRVQQWLEDQCEKGLLPPQEDAPFYLQAVRAGAPDLLAIAPGTERQRR